MSRGVKIQADIAIEDCVNEKYDLIVLPGVGNLSYIIPATYLYCCMSVGSSWSRTFTRLQCID